MDQKKNASDGSQASQTKKPRLVPKRVIDKLEKNLNKLISKEKRLLSKIADNRNEISDLVKSDDPVTISGIRILENENLVTEIQLDKIRDKQSGIEKSLIEKLDKNDFLLNSRRNQK